MIWEQIALQGEDVVQEDVGLWVRVRLPGWREPPSPTPGRNGEEQVPSSEAVGLALSRGRSKGCRR